MSRLPVVSSDGNVWGTILNDFLSQAHNADGSIKNLFFNVKDAVYGAKLDGSTDDTTAINAALLACHTAGHGVVYVDGSTVISAPLVIYSNTTLWLTKGTTVTLAASSNCNMLKNAATTPQRSVTDAIISSSSTTLTSATANFTSADVGRTVVVTGAWTISTPLVANILSVTNSTTVTLSIAAGYSVGGVACSIYTRDSNIEICGGYWDRGANGYTGGLTQNFRQTMCLRHVDGLSIHDLTCATTQKGYFISIGDATNFHVHDITFVCPTTVFNTDGVAIIGPARFGLIENIYGTTGDDFTSVHGVDGDGVLNDVVGNVSDIVIQNLFPYLIGQGAMLQQSGSGTTVRSLTVRGVHGWTSATPILLLDDVSDVLIEDIDCMSNGWPLVEIATSNATANITLRDLSWSEWGDTVPIIKVDSGDLGDLTVDGLNIEYPQLSYAINLFGNVQNVKLSNVHKSDITLSLSALIKINAGVTVRTATIRDVSMNMVSGSQTPLILNQGTLVSATLDNIYLNSGGLLYTQDNSNSSSSQVFMHNVTLDGAYSLGKCASGSFAVFYATAIAALYVQAGTFFSLVGAGANMNVYGSGLVNPFNATAFIRDGTQTPRFRHPDMQADLAQIGQNSGDMVYNTNAATTDVGVCISNGTNWKNIYTGNIY